MFNKIIFLFVVAGVSLVPNSHGAPTALEERMSREEKWAKEGLFILPYRPIYFLPIAYNTNPNEEYFTAIGQELKHTEIKYQISFKVPVVDNLFNRCGMYFAYTQQSYWQAYNRDISSPFRDTNYEPEVFFQFKSDKTVGTFNNRINNFGFAHQSNGREDPLSRSWNRLYADFVFDRANTMISFKPWWRIPEPVETDNNPDIWKYMGYGELRLALKRRGNQVWSLMFRNNLMIDGNKGAIELGWTVPIMKSTKGYIQYFNGYGESLLDYNHPVNRLSVGVAFTDWL